MILKVSGGSMDLAAADERNAGNRKANIAMSHEDNASWLGGQSVWEPGLLAQCPQPRQAGRQKEQAVTQQPVAFSSPWGQRGSSTTQTCCKAGLC